jgi:hypothetical protein
MAIGEIVYVAEAYAKSVRHGYGRSRGVQNMWTPRACGGTVWAGRAPTPEAYRYPVHHGYDTTRGVQHICTPRLKYA